MYLKEIFSINASLNQRVHTECTKNAKNNSPALNDDVIKPMLHFAIENEETGKD